MTHADPSIQRPPFPGPVGRLAARVYGAEVARRNRRFDAGLGVTRLPIPVISVGNLSVGGTGKTPMVMRILSRLKARELRPCVAMRGYRARAGESDEAGEYSRAFPDVRVIAQPDRIAGLRALLASERGKEIDAIVLDDGFQHRRLARDLDIVLLDATRDPFEDRLLPAGWLREPVASLGRAHVALITHAESAPAETPSRIAARAAAINPRMAVAISSHAWTALQSSHEDVGLLSAPGPADLSPVVLRGRSVLVACAIGNPGPFISATQHYIAGPVAATFLRRDHDPYAPATVRALMDAARSARVDFILTTEKDWSKLCDIPRDRWPCPVLRPRLMLRIDSGGDGLDRAIDEAVGLPSPAPPARAV